MAKFNLTSPTSLYRECDLKDLDHWMHGELRKVEESAVRSVLNTVCKNLSEFVLFPPRAVLLWKGCNRVRPPGKRGKYHRYPSTLKDLARSVRIKWDTRPNGPAIMSFLIAGGERPNRMGSSNAWSIHHLYSGKFPYPGKESTLHAPKEGIHFTQSAGLIAAHPIADAICDEFPSFAWRLRAEAFLRFGYDPDGVFAEAHGDFGFQPGALCEVLYMDRPQQDDKDSGS